jgi:PKD repeat protein
MLKKLIFCFFVSIFFISVLSSCYKTPEACFTYSQTVDTFKISLDELRKKQPIEFTATCSRESNDFEWSFGDTSASETGQTVKHTYADSGSYKVILIARNNKKSSETSKYIYIHPY